MAKIVKHMKIKVENVIKNELTRLKFWLNKEVFLVGFGFRFDGTIEFWVKNELLLRFILLKIVRLTRSDVCDTIRIDKELLFKFEPVNFEYISLLAPNLSEKDGKGSVCEESASK